MISCLSVTAALEDVDFVARGRYTLTFSDVGRSPRLGVLSSMAVVQTLEDDIAESTESFVCALRLTVSPSDPLRSADPDTITVSIIDNDSECASVGQGVSPSVCAAVPAA